MPGVTYSSNGVAALILLISLYSAYGEITAKTKKSSSGHDHKFSKPEGRFSKGHGGYSGGDDRAGKVLIVHEAGEYVGHVISGGHGGGHGGNGGGHGEHGGGHGGHGGGHGGHGGHGGGHGWHGNNHGWLGSGHGGSHAWLGGGHG
ncbi:hypothetical protein AVEN_101401-1, partial [Araneus ventricosus]